MRIAYFGPWHGEFGWELMAWQAYCRERSHEFDKCYSSSFYEMRFLYEDFSRFIPHFHRGRALDWRDLSKIEYFMPSEVTDHILPIKRYRAGGEYRKLGVGSGVYAPCKVLIHARGVRRGAAKNYLVENWDKVLEVCVAMSLEMGFIGTSEDHCVRKEYFRDYRDLELEELVGLIASVDLVVGQSSGVMHLASLCGTPHLVWGDSRTYFGETLERRYKETWNPFDTSVQYIAAEDWQPEPSKVIQKIEEML